ncbi:unnamed protein product [Heligmosomoides polygyrus]|uniref:Uncharacterized protein n=1 Tax=Heligmosomoides polygyrus TaxID=6339 RepID=A0A3P8EC66_HELPZ|nr:unnamed protein product [Heligmosomoides polygyrus]
MASLSWQQSDREYISILSLVVYSALVGLMFYALSIFDLLYQHIYDEEKPESTAESPKACLLYQILHLLCDVIFCVLIVLPRVDDTASDPNLAIIHSLINIFGTAVWPTISLIVYSARVRHVGAVLSYVAHVQGMSIAYEQHSHAHISTEDRIRAFENVCDDGRVYAMHVALEMMPNSLRHSTISSMYAIRM